jgi:RNA polymerase sigma factor (sigma-70 family)
LTDREIYEEVRGPLMRFAASLVGPDRASDLVSEVMVATLQQRSLADLENPQAYLMQSALNRARSIGRTLSRERRAMSRLPAEVQAGVEPVDLLLKADIVDAVAGLPVQQRAAIYLVYWADLDASEAAELMGIRPATLRRYLFLARNKLRKWIDE